MQKQLLNDLNCKLEDAYNCDEGIKAIKSIAWKKRVLLVLDDVDQRDQIDKLAGNCSWFAISSGIIVTTRDIAVLATGEEAIGGGVLKQSNEVKAFEMDKLDSVQALKLFCKHAFGNDFAPPHCLDLSEEAVSVTGHLPLCLEIIGSYIHSRCKEEWKMKIKVLRRVPHKDVQQRLMLSYDALGFREKQMFLDIASLFIICQKNVVNPGERSRLWIHEEAFRVLERREVKQETEEFASLRTVLFSCLLICLFLFNQGSKKVEAMCLSIDK